MGNKHNMNPKKPFIILMRVIAWTVISSSNPLFGQGVGDTSPVNPERGTPLEGRKEARGEVFGYLCIADPVGEFQTYADQGYGGGVGGVLFLREDRLLGLRVEITYVEYGREYRSSNSFLDLVSTDVETTYSIESAGLGPQLSFGSGPFRPYLYGAVGISRFVTRTKEDVDFLFIDVDDESSTVREADYQLAPTVGGGVSVDIGPIFLDLSVSHQRNGVTEYLAEGANNLIRSEANLRYYRVGISLPIGGKSSTAPAP